MLMAHFDNGVNVWYLRLVFSGGQSIPPADAIKFSPCPCLYLREGRNVGRKPLLHRGCLTNDVSLLGSDHAEWGREDAYRLNSAYHERTAKDDDVEVVKLLRFAVLEEVLRHAVGVRIPAFESGVNLPNHRTAELDQLAVEGPPSRRHVVREFLQHRDEVDEVRNRARGVPSRRRWQTSARTTNCRFQVNGRRT